MADFSVLNQYYEEKVIEDPIIKAAADELRGIFPTVTKAQDDDIGYLEAIRRVGETVLGTVADIGPSIGRGVVNLGVEALDFGGDVAGYYGIESEKFNKYIKKARKIMEPINKMSSNQAALNTAPLVTFMVPFLGIMKGLQGAKMGYHALKEAKKVVQLAAPGVQSVKLTLSGKKAAGVIDALSRPVQATLAASAAATVSSDPDKGNLGNLAKRYFPNNELWQGLADHLKTEPGSPDESQHEARLRRMSNRIQNAKEMAIFAGIIEGGIVAAKAIKNMARTERPNMTALEIQRRLSNEKDFSREFPQTYKRLKAVEDDIGKKVDIPKPPKPVEPTPDPTAMSRRTFLRGLAATAAATKTGPFANALPGVAAKVATEVAAGGPTNLFAQWLAERNIASVAISEARLSDAAGVDDIAWKVHGTIQGDPYMYNAANGWLTPDGKFYDASMYDDLGSFGGWLEERVGKELPLDEYPSVSDTAFDDDHTILLNPEGGEVFLSSDELFALNEKGLGAGLMEMRNPATPEQIETLKKYVKEGNHLEIEFMRKRSEYHGRDVEMSVPDRERGGGWLLRDTITKPEQLDALNERWEAVRTEDLKHIEGDYFKKMATRGKMQQARGVRDSIKAIINRESPAQDIMVSEGGEDLIMQYEGGELTQGLEAKGLHVIDDRMGHVYVGQTPELAEAMKDIGEEVRMNQPHNANVYDMGRLYGYSPDDVAAFYDMRGWGHKEFIKDQQNSVVDPLLREMPAEPEIPTNADNQPLLKPTEPSEKNLHMDGDKPIWGAVIDPLDGYIIETITYEHAADNDFHHSFYMSPKSIQLMEDGEAIAAFDNGDGWLDGYGGELPEQTIKDLDKQLPPIAKSAGAAKTPQYELEKAKEKEKLIPLSFGNEQRVTKGEAGKAVLKATGKHGKITVDDLGKYFTKLQKEQHGKPLDIFNPADRKKAAKAAAAEIKYQDLTQEISGKGWYDKDIADTFYYLSHVPGLESLVTNDDHRVIFTAIAGVTSNGTKVLENVPQATYQMRGYLKTGKIPAARLPPKTPKAVEEKRRRDFPEGLAPRRRDAVVKNMRVIRHLLKEKGEEGFAEWWVAEHPYRELQEIRKAVGIEPRPKNVNGNADDMKYGFKIIGDKTGNFSGVMNGVDATVKDVWNTRSTNRIFGTMFEKGKLVEAPRNASEGQAMDEFWAEVAAEVGENLRDTQAMEWYYEQQLYTSLGVKSIPENFSNGAIKALERFKVEIPELPEDFGVHQRDAVQVEEEPGTEIGVEPDAGQLIKEPDLTITGLRSRSTEAVLNAPFKKGQGNQWVKLPGMKREEIEAIGLAKFDSKDKLVGGFLAKTNKSISQEAVLDYMTDHGLGLGETIYGSGPTDTIDAEAINHARQMKADLVMLHDRFKGIVERTDPTRGLEIGQVPTPVKRSEVYNEEAVIGELRASMAGPHGVPGAYDNVVGEGWEPVLSPDPEPDDMADELLYWLPEGYQIWRREDVLTGDDRVDAIIHRNPGQMNTYTDEELDLINEVMVDHPLETPQAGRLNYPYLILDVQEDYVGVGKTPEEAAKMARDNRSGFRHRDAGLLPTPVGGRDQLRPMLAFIDTRDGGDDIMTHDEVQRIYDEIIVGGNDNATRYGDTSFSMAGGEKNTEILLKLPPVMTREEAGDKANELIHEMHKKYGDGWRNKATLSEIEAVNELDNIAGGPSTTEMLGGYDVIETSLSDLYEGEAVEYDLFETDNLAHRYAEVFDIPPERYDAEVPDAREDIVKALKEHDKANEKPTDIVSVYKYSEYGVEVGIQRDGKFNVINYNDEYTFETLEEAEDNLLEFLKGEGATFTEKNYTNDHWPGQKNVLAHIRGMDRKMAWTNQDGEDKTTDIFFGDEWQSDWHKAGQREGYNTPEKIKQIVKIENAIREGASKDNLDEAFSTVVDAMKKEGLDIDEVPLVLDDSSFALHREDWPHDSATARVRVLQAYAQDAGMPNPGGVPDAPFKKTWPLLIAKRMIMEAVARGKDGIGWTSAETQLDRNGRNKKRTKGMRNFYGDPGKRYNKDGGELELDSAQHWAEPYPGQLDHHTTVQEFHAVLVGEFHQWMIDEGIASSASQEEILRHPNTTDAQAYWLRDWLRRESELLGEEPRPGGKAVQPMMMSIFNKIGSDYNLRVIENGFTPLYENKTEVANYVQSYRDTLEAMDDMSLAEEYAEVTDISVDDAMEGIEIEAENMIDELVERAETTLSYRGESGEGFYEGQEARSSFKKEPGDPDAWFFPFNEEFIKAVKKGLSLFGATGAAIAVPALKKDEDPSGHLGEEDGI